MNRLSNERQRLFALSPDQVCAVPGGTRALCVTLSCPAEWSTLSRLWEGVQDAWQWPAPAVAVSGTDGLQLWFSLQEQLDEARAQSVLQTLCQHFLADVPSQRIQLHTSDQALPPQAAANGNWSAFVAPGLASVFADEPWLDRPPSDDAQAELLAKLASIRPADLSRLTTSANAHHRPSPQVSPSEVAAPAYGERCGGDLNDPNNPRAFLLRVMNDSTVPLALRIEAAKALLPPHS